MIYTKPLSRFHFEFSGDTALVLNGGRCRHQYSDMLNQVYSTHLQAQIQQHASTNHSPNFNSGRYRSSMHPHPNNHHVQQLQHYAHHQYLHHDHEHEAYSHQGW